jgi:calcineurin-like phosphoesterase family protein
MRYCGRPFFTVAAMDEEMIRRWNEVVAPEDIVYHLGDVAMKVQAIERILPRLHGRKILIVGNHDLIYPYFLKTRGKKFVEEMSDRYKKAGFEQILPSGTILKIESLSGIQKARLSHFPTKNTLSYHDAKHDAARPEDNGLLNICGHVHQSWLKRGNNINVGVDVWNFTPVSLVEVVNLWRFGPKNVETPKKLRISLWKAYHTLVYEIRCLLRLEKKVRK